MYRIDELVRNGYKFLYESEDLKEIDKIIFNLHKLNVACRVLHDDQLLVFLDGSKHQYMYWKNQYVRDNNMEKKLARLKR